MTGTERYHHAQQQRYRNHTGMLSSGDISLNSLIIHSNLGEKSLKENIVKKHENDKPTSIEMNNKRKIFPFIFLIQFFLSKAIFIWVWFNS